MRLKLSKAITVVHNMELNGMIERSESMSGAGEAGANLSDLLCVQDVLIAPSDWDCFGLDDCSSLIMASCYRSDPVLCVGCTKAANAHT